MNNINNKSIWDQYKSNKNYPKLVKDITTDCLVIGGGIVGILCAYQLNQNNINVVLVEQNKIGSGVTSKTSAFVTAQHETLYQDLAKRYGLDVALEYFIINNDAIKEYIKLSEKYDFDLEETTSTLFSSNIDIISKEYQILKKIGVDAYINNNIPYYNDGYGITFNKQLIINPMKLINALSNDLEIYENSKVIKLKKNYAILDNNCIIRFNKVIIATNYPINNKLNMLFMKITQRVSYLVCVKSENVKGNIQKEKIQKENILEKKVQGTYCSLDDGLYFRSYKDYLLVGGNDRDTGSLCINIFINEVIKRLNIKKEDIIYSWSGQDCITCDGIPYIGKSDIFHKNHFVVSGFNLWGFTFSLFTSKLVLNYVLDNKNYKLTRINRFVLNKNLIKNIKNSIKYLLKFNKPRCKHFGCALVYNKQNNICYRT